VDLTAQYKWDWHDPIDLNLVDFGDNKVLLYNAIGVGLTLKLSDLSPVEKKLYKDLFFASYVDVLYEYSRPPKSDIVTGRFRWGKNIRKHLALGVDMSVYKVGDSQVSTFGAGTQLFFSWYMVRRDNWLVYYDNGVGPNYFAEPFPFGGTRFNFTTFYGINVAYKVPGVAWVTVGIRNIHISNAGIHGAERNPALDGLGLTIGYQFY
jgi:hypothetical protein